ncbi:MAG: 1-acyl-sn-glycerol-3-phosphate acyltransferase, partial [Bradymonadia bacterium]
TFDELPPYWQSTQVIIGFPHSALIDTAMAFGGFAIIEQKGHILIKKEAFRGPLRPFLNWLGAVAIDRHSPTGVVDQIVAEFEARDVFQLALVPEGTRKGTTRLKTGFWHIARGAGVPIVCWYLDAANKRTRWLGSFEPTDDLQADLQRIKALYADAGHDIVEIE